MVKSDKRIVIEAATSFIPTNLINRKEAHKNFRNLFFTKLDTPIENKNNQTILENFAHKTLTQSNYNKLCNQVNAIISNLNLDSPRELAFYGAVYIALKDEAILETLKANWAAEEKPSSTSQEAYSHYTPKYNSYTRYSDPTSVYYSGR